MTKTNKVWCLAFSLPLILEVAALYYQYVLNYGPCTICVQIRATLAATIIIGVLGYFLNALLAQRVLSLILTGLMGLFLYQGYLIIGIERYWFESSCTLTNAFPAWMPLDQWLPSIFEPWELCGYTPYIIGKLTMAETLVFIALSLLIISVLNTISLFRKTPTVL